jgi:hypothetical protein
MRTQPVEFPFVEPCSHEGGRCVLWQVGSVGGPTAAWLQALLPLTLARVSSKGCILCSYMCLVQPLGERCRSVWGGYDGRRLRRYSSTAGVPRSRMRRILCVTSGNRFQQHSSASTEAITQLSPGRLRVRRKPRDRLLAAGRSPRGAVCGSNGFNTEPRDSPNEPHAIPPGGFPSAFNRGSPVCGSGGLLPVRDVTSPPALELKRTCAVGHQKTLLRIRSVDWPTKNGHVHHTGDTCSLSDSRLTAGIQEVLVDHSQAATLLRRNLLRTSVTTEKLSNS